MIDLAAHSHRDDLDLPPFQERAKAAVAAQAARAKRDKARKRKKARASTGEGATGAASHTQPETPAHNASGVEPAEGNVTAGRKRVRFG